MNDIRYQVHHFADTASGRKGHRVFVSGSGLSHVSVIDYDGSVLWTMPQSDLHWEEVNDGEVLPNGQIVLAVRGQNSSAVYMIRPDYRKGCGYDILWKHPVPADFENHTAQLLENGNILISYQSRDRVILAELDAQGRLLHQIGDGEKKLPGFEQPVSCSHVQVRQIRKTANNTYLLPRFDGQKTVELDADGNLLHAYSGVGGFAAVEDGEHAVIITGGDGHYIRCLSRETQELLWEISIHDIPDVTLGFVASVELQPNGNIVFANWGGHGGASGYSVIEMNPRTKELIWCLDVESLASNIQILDTCLSDAVLSGMN